LNGTAGIRDQVWGQPSTPPSPAAKHPIHAPTPQVLKSHSNVEPIKKRRRGDAGVRENAPKSRTAVGESDQSRMLGAPDSVEVSVDQHLQVRFGFGDGTENLPSTKFRFNIADAYLKMPLRFLATPDEGRIQGHHDSGRRYFWPRRGTLTDCLADFQGMTPQGLSMLRDVNRKNLLQKISRGSIGHEGGEMRL
jgi:hypothetical protein